MTVDPAGFFALGLAKQQEASRGLAIQEGQLAIQQRGLELKEAQAAEQKIAKLRQAAQKDADAIIQQGLEMAKLGLLDDEISSGLKQSLSSVDEALQQAGMEPLGLVQKFDQLVSLTPTVQQTGQIQNQQTIADKQAQIEAGVAAPVDTRTVAEKQADTRAQAVFTSGLDEGKQRRLAKFRDSLAKEGSESTLTGRQVRLGDGHSSPVTRINGNDFFTDQTGTLRSVKELPTGSEIFTTQSGKLPASKQDELEAGIAEMDAVVAEAENFLDEAEDTDLGTVGGITEFSGRVGRTVGDLAATFLPEGQANAVRSAANRVFGEDGQIDLDDKALQALEFRLEEALISSMRLARGRAPLAETQRRIRERVQLRGGVQSAEDVRAKVMEVVTELKENARRVRVRAGKELEGQKEQAIPDKRDESGAPVGKVFTLEELEALAAEPVQ